MSRIPLAKRKPSPEQMVFEGMVMSEEFTRGFRDADSGNPQTNTTIQYCRGYEIRLQQIATSVEQERKARLGY